MKKTRFNPLLVSLMIAFLLLMVSCTKDQALMDNNIVPTTPERSTTVVEIADDIHVDKGILNFNDLEDFHSTLVALTRMDKAAQIQWEQEIGFISMRSIFNKIMSAEYTDRFNGHTDIYNNYMNTGMIVPDEVTGLYKMDIFNPAYANVVNEDGIVIVENVLYQFAGDALKMWTDATAAQANELMNITEATENVQIVPIQMERAQNREKAYWLGFQEKRNANTLMAMEGYFYSHFQDAVPHIINNQYYVYVVVFMKEPGSEIWVFDDNARIQLFGHDEVRYYMTDGVSYMELDIQNSDIDRSRHGGFYVVYPEWAGIHELLPPKCYTKPAQMMRNEWKTDVWSSSSASWWHLNIGCPTEE